MLKFDEMTIANPFSGLSLGAALKSIKIPTFISLALIALSFTPLGFVSLIGCIVLGAIYWPFPKLLNSFILRLVVSFALVSSFQQLTAALFWLARFDYTVSIAVVLELVVLLVLIALGIAKPQFSKRTIINRDDIAAVLVATVTAGVVLYYMLSGGTLLQQLVRQVTTGYDNIQHISLTQTLYENKGYVWGEVDDVIDTVMYYNLASYPQGWSMTTSVWWQGITDDANIQTHPAKVLGLYVGFSLLWYTLAIYLFCRLLLALVGLYRNKVSSMTTLIGGIVFTCVAQLAFLMAVLYNGFASFMPSLLFPLAIVYLSAGLLFTKERTSPYIFMISGLLLSGGMAFSWLLIAPAAYITVLVALVAYFRGSLLATLRWLFVGWWRALTALLLVGTASIQGYVQLRYGVDDLVNMPGGVNDINNILLILFLASGLLGAAYYKGKAVKDLFVVSLSGGIVVAGGVYLYQFFSSGVATYFSTKAAYVPLMLIFLFGAVALVALIEDHIVDKSGRALGAVFLVALAVFLPIATNMNLGTSPQLGIGIPNYIAGKRFLSEYSASQVSNLLADKKLNDGALVMFKHLGYAEDLTTTHFSNMIARTPRQGCNNIIGDLSSQWDVKREQVTKCAGGKDLFIVASGSNYDRLVDEYRNDRNVTVILSN